MSTIFLVDTMNTSTIKAQTRRTRRKHTAEFKAQVIAACLQPDTSVAAVALANQLNANYLRSLVKKHRKPHGGLPATVKGHSAPGPAATLVPVAVQTAEVPSSGDIQISRPGALGSSNNN